MNNNNSINIGDIFCVEIGDSFKCYFQFIGIDKTKCCTPVINIFKKHYPIHYIPSLENIVKDDLLCSVHTEIYDKYINFPWYKIGNRPYISSNGAGPPLFIDSERPNEEILSKTNSVEYSYWWVWEMNGSPVKQFPVPYEYIDRMENGAILYPEQIIDRIIYGYDRKTSAVYNVIRRRPRRGVQSFIKTQCVPTIIYYHFNEEYLVRQISISKTKGTVKINKYENEEKMKFWDINWKEYEFITQEQFETVWDFQDNLQKTK